MKKALAFIGVIVLLCSSVISHAQTRVVFNKPVDFRYAWLNNDAEENVNFESEIINIINSATTSIDVATMTFSMSTIGLALKARSDAGVKVRVIGNSSHMVKSNDSFGSPQVTGYLHALKGANTQVVDNNLPSLIHQINFQKDAGAPPAGWLADKGDVYGPRGGGLTYGWTVNETANMRTGGAYNNSLLDDCFGAPNSSTHTWEIALPNGYYYVAFVSGQPGFGSKNYVLAEGQKIVKGGAYHYTNCAPDVFYGATVDGGTDDGEDADPNAVRLHVTDGKLTLTVGTTLGVGWSSICYVQIYKSDATEPNGDTSYEDGNDTEVQDRQTHHSKYILADGGTAAAKLWVSSGNLTQSMISNSEDAIVTQDSGVCNAFLNQFNQQWGGAVGTNPTPANSNFGTYKSATPALNVVVNGYPWNIRFSPSIVANYDMADEMNGLVTSAGKNLVFAIEQFSNSFGARGFDGAGRTYATTIPNKLSVPAFESYGLAGGTFSLADFPQSNAHFATTTGSEIHNKYALADALNDTRTKLQGKMVCGSMNWTQSALHYNDEQSLFIKNPYIVNQYLQHAMARLREKGIEKSNKSDIILIFDRSYSMNALSLDGTTPKIDASKSAAKLFLDILEDDGTSKVSMIRFGNSVEPFAPPVTLTPFNAVVRTDYKNQITGIVANLPIGSHTCYGLPLQEAATQLMGSPTLNPRRIIHFFTDGKENQAPYSSSALPPLTVLGAEIHSTAFGAASDDLTSLINMANATGGTYAQVSLDEMALKKRFTEVAREAIAFETVLDPSYVLYPGKPVTETFYLDQSTRTVKLVLSWPQNINTEVVMNIYAPDGSIITEGTPGATYKRSEGYLVVTLDIKKLDLKTFDGKWVAEMIAKEGKYRFIQADLVIIADTDLDFKAELIPNFKDIRDVKVLFRLLNNGTPWRIKDAIINLTYPLKSDKEKALTETIKVNIKEEKNGVYSFDLPYLDQSGNYTIHLITYSEVKGSKDYIPIRREYTLNYTTPYERQPVSFKSARNAIDNPAKFSVYPNPSTGSFTIQGFEGSGKMIIYSVLGEKIKEREVCSGESVNDLKKGYYIIQIVTDKETFRSPVIIE